MEHVYHQINTGLAALGVGYRVDSLAEVGIGVVAMLFFAWLVLHLIFDD